MLSHSGRATGAGATAARLAATTPGPTSHILGWRACVPRHCPSQPGSSLSRGNARWDSPPPSHPPAPSRDCRPVTLTRVRSCRSAPLRSPFHDHMPVILCPDDYDTHPLHWRARNRRRACGLRAGPTHARLKGWGFVPRSAQDEKEGRQLACPLPARTCSGAVTRPSTACSSSGSGRCRPPSRTRSACPSRHWRRRR